MILLGCSKIKSGWWAPLKKYFFQKLEKIKNTWLPGTCRKCLGSNNYFGNFWSKKGVGILEKVLVSTLATMFLFWKLGRYFWNKTRFPAFWGRVFVGQENWPFPAPQKLSYKYPPTTYTYHSMSLCPHIPTIKPLHVLLIFFPGFLQKNWRPKLQGPNVASIAWSF